VEEGRASSCERGERAASSSAPNHPCVQAIEAHLLDKDLQVAITEVSQDKVSVGVRVGKARNLQAAEHERRAVPVPSRLCSCSLIQLLLLETSHPHTQHEHT